MDHRLLLVLLHPCPSLGPPPPPLAAVTSVRVVVEGAVERQCPRRSFSLLVLSTPWPSPPSTLRTGGRLAAAAACTWTARGRTSPTRRMGETMPSTSTGPPHLAASLHTPERADPRGAQDTEEGEATGNKLHVGGGNGIHGGDYGRRGRTAHVVGCFFSSRHA